MARFFSFQRLSRKRTAAVAASTATCESRTVGGTPCPLWSHSSQYGSIVEEGHRRPPPAFGTPTLVWHLGIWQRVALDERGERAKVPGRSSMADFDQYRKDVADNIDARNEALFSEVSRVLACLQERGRALGSDVQVLQFVEPPGLGSDEEARQALPHRFKVCEPQSLAFTLWWQDEAADGHPNHRPERPQAGDLRVRVQAQAHLEHATITFFIDVGKPWNSEPVLRSSEAIGRRRQSILRDMERIRAISNRQVKQGRIERDLSPEQLDTTEDAHALLESANYLYDGIWQEFMAAFGLSAPDAPTPGGLRFEGEIFANFRGLILSTEGLSTPVDERYLKDVEGLREANLESSSDIRQDAKSSIGFGRFRVFDNESGEPNSVLRSYWPFIRRLTPDTDRRDFVGCGILDWRCLYVSALGSPVDGAIGDEAPDSSWDAPFGALPPAWNSAQAASQPLRYLILTKGEPHRQQLGRFVERVNAVETMRLFALKHWPTIHNAAILVRVLGRELDDVLSRWSFERSAIDDAKRAALAKARDKRFSVERFLWRFSLSNLFRRSLDSSRWTVEPPWIQRIKDKHLADLGDLIDDTERQLISIGASLDKVGRNGAGRLLYAIDRSKYFIREFEGLAATLEIGNIDGWINYKQFIDRGLKPTFELIRRTSDNHAALRGRLQMVSNMIQTSALIVETGATSRNTEILRKIATEWRWTKWSIAGLAAAILLQLIVTKSLDAGLAWIGGLLR